MSHDHGGGDDDYGAYRPSIRDSLTNWRTYDGPLFKKLGLTAKNEWRKLRRFKDCCDNIDEPGC